MQSVEEQILTSLGKCGRGTVFFADRFSRLGNADRLHKAMELLAKRGDILRVARGIYCYPKKTPAILRELGITDEYSWPSPDEIAEAIAKRDSVKIAPTALHAQNLLGLSQQVVMNFVYLTSGRAKVIKLYTPTESGPTAPNRQIEFKHTVARNLAFTNRLAMLITFALKDYGQEGVTAEHIKKIKELLSHEKQENIERDYPLMPEWIREILKNCYE